MLLTLDCAFIIKALSIHCTDQGEYLPRVNPMRQKAIRLHCSPSRATCRWSWSRALRRSDFKEIFAFPAFRSFRIARTLATVWKSKSLMSLFATAEDEEEASLLSKTDDSLMNVRISITICSSCTAAESKYISAPALSALSLPPSSLCPSARAKQIFIRMFPPPAGLATALVLTIITLEATATDPGDTPSSAVNDTEFNITSLEPTSTYPSTPLPLLLLLLYIY